MPRAKSLLKTGVFLACLAVIGFLGSQAGRYIARSGVVHRSASKSPTKMGEAAAAAETHTKEEARPETIAASIRKLKGLLENSPDFRTDLEAQTEADTVIAKLSAAELAEVFTSLEGQYDDPEQILLRKIGAAWMALDADSALKAALGKEPNYRSYVARKIFQAWAQDSPTAALAWLNSADLPKDPSTLREDFRQAALKGIVERDFSMATAEYLKSNGPSAYGSGGMMSWWAQQYADDPTMRNRLIDFAKSTGRPNDFSELNRELILAWPQEDALGTISYLQDLRSYLESDSVPAEARPKVDATAVGAAIDREYDRAALEWWMERYGDAEEAPAPLRQAMDRWARKYPDKVTQWFEEQPPSPQRDALAASVVPALLGKEKFTEVVQSIESMQGTRYRQAAIERLNILWSKKDPDAAATWRATLPAGSLPE